MEKQKKAVVLLSGGLDSTTVLYYAKEKGFDCFCLIFDYGQRHKKEIEAARKIAKKAGFPFKILKLSFPFKNSSLLNMSLKIPSANSARKTALPSTYVPGRNTIFLSHALSLAESIKASAIFIGANEIDYSGYPDCRPDYLRAWQRLVNSLGLEIKIQAPLIHMNKAQIVELGQKLGAPLDLTWSCYRGGKKPCGKCDSCAFRQKGFSEAGFTDPII